jgi:hypothetical protein
MGAHIWPEIVSTLIKPNGLETPYRIGNDSGDVFEEGDDFDGMTLTIAVTSAEEAQAMIAAIEGRRPPDALSQGLSLALNEGDGVYRP